MSFDNLVVFLLVFRCEVEISWAFLDVFYVVCVAGPLGHDWEGELVDKEFLVQLVDGGGSTTTGEKRGRTAP